MVLKFWLVTVLVVLAGCTPFSREGLGGEAVTVGKLILPVPCFEDFCPDTEEGYPLPFARVVAFGEQGETVETVSDCSGQYVLSGMRSGCGVVYAQRGEVTLAGGFTAVPPGVCRVDVYTTAQVAIFEAARRLYPQAVYYRDIPNFLPSEILVRLVKEAIRRRENPLEDRAVQEEAHRLIDVWFGGKGEEIFRQ